MSKMRLVGLGALLALAPLATAHLDGSAGVPKTYCEDDDLNIHDYGSTPSDALLAGFADGNLGDCDADDLPADYDGHSEFAQGGAWLLVTSGDGGYGSLACFGEAGHHPLYGPIHVTDVSAASGVPFVVAVDTQSLVPPVDPSAPACGDNLADHSVDCVDSCTVDFAPGLDGSYHVFTSGPGGHVWTDLV